MIEALWKVEFISSLGNLGAGVVVFKSNKIFGGDSIYYYLGNFEIKNERASAEVEVTYHSGTPLSVFGPKRNFKIRVAGKVQEPVMDLKGYLESDPSSEITVRCTKITDLP